ncbi:MAG: hypothetical protein QG626_578 [Patescibacteria group bacterium]|jgi:hypothetical protein|nr:hypothetical protein [Patescibacteria group bacterium]
MGKGNRQNVVVGLDQLGKAMAAREVHKNSPEVRMATLSDLIQGSLRKLRDTDDFWNAGVEVEDREAMIFSAVGRTEDYTSAEIQNELSGRGRKDFFSKVNELRAWSDELNELTAAESARDARSFEIERARTALVHVPEAVAIAKQKDLARLRERAKGTYAGPGKEPIALPDRAIDALQVVEDPELAPAESPFFEALNTAAHVAATRDAARALAGAEQAAGVLHKRAVDDSSSAFFESVDQELRNYYGDDMPPPPPEDEPLQAEVVPDVDGARASLEEVAVLVARGDLTDIERAEVEEKLDDALMTLSLEDARITGLFGAKKLTKEQTLEKRSLRDTVARLRKERTRLHRVLNKENRKAVFAEAEVPVSEAHPQVLERAEGRGFVLQSQLDVIRSEIAEARQMLRESTPDVRKVNDVLVATDVVIDNLLRAISEEKTRGKDVDLLEFGALSALRDLRRVQDATKDRVAQMTNVEVKHEGEALRMNEFGEVAAETPEVMEMVAPPKPKRVAKKSVAKVVAEISPEGERAPTPALVQEPKGVFARARARLSGALDYIRHGWDRALREEVYGELSPQELGEAQGMSREEYILRGSAAVLGGVASTFGVALAPDLARYVAQSHYTGREKAELATAVQEALRTAAQKTEASLDVQADLAARKQKIVKRINASRYLSKEAKASLMVRLVRISEAAQVAEVQVQDRWEKELKQLLDAHITTKVTEGKVVKELANSASVAGSIAAVASGYGSIAAGLHFMRGPAYAFQNFVQEQRRANKEKALGERVDARAVMVMKEGFANWWKAAFRQSEKSEFGKSVDQLRAFSTLSRTLGFAGVSSLAAGELTREAMHATGISDLLEKGFEKVEAYAGDLHGQLFGRQESEVNVPVDRDTQRFGERIETPATEPEPESPDYQFHGEIPVGSRVLGDSKTEGITYVLKRVIQANPEAYGFDGDSELSEELFAKRLAVKIAEQDGQMRRWLTSKAIDRLNLFPEYVNGDWHLAAVVDGKKLSLDDLIEQGFTSAAPASSK